MAPESGKVPLRTVLVAVFVLLTDCQDLDPSEQASSRCYDDQGKPQRCIPEFVNAAYNVRVEVTNTCGLQGPSEYCLQTSATGAKKSCEICDADVPHLAHPTEYLTDFNNNDNQTWWQSDTMYDGIHYPNIVNLTLYLGKSFDITYVRLKFHSSRPESFGIYKRIFADSSWIPYQYYSATCRDTYSISESTFVTRDDETIALCSDEFSDISPLTGGNVAFSTLEGRPSAYDFEDSPILQDWVTATDIRISLYRLNTFGDQIFGDPKVLKSYYYAISDFAVGGRCKCNGHASACSTREYGLQCDCEHYTAGVDCQECLPFYNDKPWHHATSVNAHECQPCNCNGRSEKCFFDQELFDRTGHGGHCIDCRDNTDGPNCERCKDNFYERNDGRCVACNCDPTGSRSLQCNSNGQCSCKPGVEGHRCERCAPNFYEFSALGCRPCGCSTAGSENNSPACDTLTGTCRCKENVEGQRCDRCKPGYFDLQEAHQFGCLSCFCYGHSSVCRSTPGYSKFSIESTFTRDKERWMAADRGNREVPFQYNSVIQNIAVSTHGREPVYFVATSRFLGDQRASYNQFLRFSLRIGEDGPQATVEDIVLEGAGMRISQPIFGQDNQLPTNRKQEYRFQMHENPAYGWNPRLTPHDFVSVLANLTAIKIKGTYTPEGTGFLDDVRLESAQRAASGQESSWIETCTCPDSYIGQFCESCAPQFRHDPPGGGRFSMCVPCNCHGHAEYCDPDTGRCICQHNTAGDTCERCAPGYYGNALQGTHSDCKSCPCPNQGACVVLPDEQVACLQCPAGYAGHKCNLCVDGYYGDPLGRYGLPRPCQPCHCNGNIDTNAVGNCNTTTGECLKCIYNTAGKQCQKCLPGFFGNALSGTKGECQACDCFYLGTVDGGHSSHGGSHCDPVNGQCSCKTHVGGRQCERCEDGYWNINSGIGCEACNCDLVGSYNRSCELGTGQCYCRPGVTGAHCDACMPFHYGFSVDGCKACNCDPIGSTALQCYSSGQCPCRPNVEGRTCDKCRENKYNKEVGCVDCPPCYSLVQDAVNVHRSKVEELYHILEEIRRNPEVIENKDFEKQLEEVTDRVVELLTDARKAAGEEGNLIAKLKDLRERIEMVKKTADNIVGVIREADGVSSLGVRNITLAGEIIYRADQTLASIKKYLDTEGRDALAKARDRSHQFGQQSARMSEIAREARTLANQHEEEAIEIEGIASEALNTSAEAYKLAKDAIDTQEQTREEVDNLKRELNKTADLLQRTKKLADETRREAGKAYDDALDIYTNAESITMPDVDPDRMKEKAEDIIKDARRIRGEADDLMDEHQKAIDDLDGKKKEAEELLAEGMHQQQITDELLADADAALDKAKQAVSSGDKTLEDAQKTLETLKGFDKSVQESKDNADDALSKVPEIERLIADAESKTKEAEDALRGADQDANNARDIAIEAEKIAELASKEAGDIKKDADQTKDRAEKLGDQANDLQGQVADTSARMKDYENQAKADETLAKEALEKANLAKTSAQDASKKVKNGLDTVESILRSLDDIDGIDTDLLGRLERKLAQAEQELREADLDAKMGDLRKAREQQKQWMRNYDDEIEQLKKDVANVADIRNSLPDSCYRRVKLEP